ncbi:MAG: hypothetical protein ABW217_08125, partial [Polyangiaceae bacterium]
DYGARPLGRIVQDQIKRPLGDELLFGKLSDGGKVFIDVDLTAVPTTPVKGDERPSPLRFSFESDAAKTKTPDVSLN